MKNDTKEKRMLDILDRLAQTARYRRRRRTSCLSRRIMPMKTVRAARRTAAIMRTPRK